MEPRKGVLRAYLNWAKYKDSPALAARFLADLAAAQRLDPKCAELFWFEGEIRKIKDVSRLRASARR